MEPLFTRPLISRSFYAQCRIRLLSPRIFPRCSASTTSRDDAGSGTTSEQQPTTRSSDASIARPSLSSSSPDPTIKHSQPSLNNVTSGPSQNESAGLDALSAYINSNPPINPNYLGALGRQPPPPPHHLHVYATKHNTHITLSKPDRNPILSVSSGTIGFRKAARGSYDAGYQLGAYVMGRIQQQGLLKEIKQLEVVLRDFGPGREAITKILLGSEGRNLRGRVIRVCDATRLKFGGTRSPKPRRLG